MYRIFLLRIKQMKKEYIIYVTMFIVSIVLTGLMGGAFDGVHKSKVFLNYDNNNSIQVKIANSLIEKDAYNYTKVTSIEDAKETVKSDDALFIIDLEEYKDIESGSDKISFIYGVEGFDLWQMKMNLQGVLSTLERSYKFAQNVNGIFDNSLNQDEIGKISDRYRYLFENKKIYEIQTERLDQGNSYSNTKHTAIGYTVFFSMFIILFGVGSIVRDRETNAWKRLTVSPLKEWQCIGGTLIFTFFIGCIQMCLYYLSGKYMFGVTWGNSNLGVITVMASYVFSVTCLSLFVVTLLKNYVQLSAFSAIFITGTSMLGGTMWPLEIVQNKIVRNLANFTPQKWAVEGLENIAMYGKGVESVKTPVLVLLLMGAVMFILAVISLRLQRGRNN